jgi:hypothetical protein
LGILKSYFVDTVDISKVNCNEFTVAWGQNARSSKITSGASGQYFYIEGLINKVYFRVKTSVRFSHEPLLIVGKGACTSSLQGVAATADSISYDMRDPLSGPGAPIPYVSGYSRDAPLKFDGYPDTGGTFDPPVCKGFHLNPITGELDFKATQTDITTIVIDATLWNKDSIGKYQMSAVIRRDVVLSVIEIPQNRFPVLSIPGGSLIIRHCIGTPLSIPIQAYDPDMDDSVSMTWDSGIAGATFKIKAAKWPKAEFYWNPDSTQIRNEPYRFMVSLSDSVCPIPGVVNRIFSVYLSKKAPTFTMKKTVLACDNYRFEAVPLSLDTAGTTYSWFIKGQRLGAGHIFVYRFIKAGKYPVRLVVTRGCDQVFYDTIDFKPQLIEIVGRTRKLCYSDTLTLTANGPGKTFTWLLNGQIIDTGKKIIISPLKTAAYSDYYVVAEDSTACLRSDSIRIFGYECVLPGDANRDGVADYRDLLDIGYGYGSKGHLRTDTTTDWSPKMATTWGMRIDSSDYMHLDCNGDGEINNKDTSAIARNYKKQRDIKRSSIGQGMPLAFDFEKDTLYAGDTAIVYITVGSQAYSNNLNGLAFSYEFTNELVRNGSFGYTWKPNIFSVSQVRLDMHRETWPGYGEASISRAGKSPVTINSAVYIAESKCVIKDSTKYSYPANGEWFKMSFFNYYAIGASGQIIPLSAQNDSVLVFKSRKKDTVSSVRYVTTARDIKIYPNPAKDEVFLESGVQTMREIKLVNMMGETVEYARPEMNRTRLTPSHLARGLYIVVISIDNGVAIQKLLVE